MLYSTENNNNDEKFKMNMIIHYSFIDLDLFRSVLFCSVQQEKSDVLVRIVDTVVNDVFKRF